MIHAITRQLGVALRDIGCPFPVKYGPLEAEPIPARGGGLIVVQRQGEPESIGTLPSQRQNPKGAGRKRISVTSPLTA